MAIAKRDKSGTIKTQQGCDSEPELLDQKTVRADRCSERRHRDIGAEIGKPPVSGDPAMGGQQESAEEP